MTRHYVLRVVAKFLIPFILLFALYGQFHGDSGPGGGFQAGVIFAAGFIISSLVFGLQAARRVAPPSLLERLVAARYGETAPDDGGEAETRAVVDQLEGAFREFDGPS